VDMLVAAIQRGQRGVPEHPLRTEIEGTWIPGKTTARRRAAPRRAERVLPGGRQSGSFT